MKLELAPEDRDLLIRVLETVIGDTRSEVRRTRAPEFHDSLLAEESRLKTLVARLRSLEAGS
jgi:hypothetical protein